MNSFVEIGLHIEEEIVYIYANIHNDHYSKKIDR